MRFLGLFLIIISCFFLQGYEYKYNVPPLDATNNATSHNSKGIMYMEMGQYAAAMSEFKIAISLNPDSPASAAYYNNLGLLYMKLNQLNKAQECFNAAIKINPVFIEYHRNLIRLYDKAGILDTVLSENLKAIKNDDKNSQAYFMAGLICAQMGRKNNAIQYLKTFTSLEKNQILSRAVKQYISELKK